MAISSDKRDQYPSAGAASARQGRLAMLRGSPLALMLSMQRDLAPTDSPPPRFTREGESKGESARESESEGAPS
jgi:hypothetical protein